MKGNQQNNKKLAIIRFAIIFAIIFIMIFLGTSYIFYKELATDVVEADNFEESISLMSDKSAINLALQYERQIQEAERERIRELEELEKKRQEELEAEDKKNVKRAYLTFDDGPSAKVTPQILDILEEYDVKATFFVVGTAVEKYPEILKRTYQDGHAIGNHTYSHRYGYIYRKPSNLLKEVEITDRLLKRVLGEDFDSKLFRFPGGSFGDEKAPFRKAIEEKGYIYYDWNSLNGDAEGYLFPKERLIQRFKNTFRGQKELVILMHDTDAKYTTPEALPYIIEYLQEQGYEFHTLK